MEVGNTGKARWKRRAFCFSESRRIDGKNGSIVGQYDCKKRSHEEAKDAPTKEQLLANNSALLNSLLMKMAETCAAEFEAEVLSGLPATEPTKTAQN